MLTFLRKHQKFFFIVVSVVTIASFLFFGTFDTFDSADKGADREVGKAIDGSSVMERDLQAMNHFLSSAGSAVIQNDFLATGLGVLLAEKYFDQIKDDLQIRLEKAKKFRPYVHPQASFISAEEVWNRFMPQMAHHLAQIKEAELSPQAFSIFCHLFLDQAIFSSDILGRILAYQQKQYEWLQPDSSLHPERLALFGYQTMEDWFGSKYLELSSRFLIDAAKLAEEKGYSISNDEARAGLLQNALQSLQARESRKEYTYADAADFLREQLIFLGIDESSAIKIWKRVLLFRRLFDGVGTGIVVDPFTYEKFSAYAGEKATIELYQLPEQLRFADLRSAFKFQLYLDAIAPKNRQTLSKLPKQMLSPEEVEKKWPELVQTRFYLEVAKVSKEELSQKISLKETWNWEKSDAGWDLLKKEFPIIAVRDPKNCEERMQALDAMDPNLRFKIDQKARYSIVDANPHWREEALRSLEPEKLWVGIRSKGAVYPFLDVSEPLGLISLLSTAPIGEKKIYASSSGETFYQVTVLEKNGKREVMTFAEAAKEEILGELLDRQLQEAYADIRKKEPAVFQTEGGAWRPFEDVKDQVGIRYFASVMKADITQRLSEYMAAAFENLQQLGESSPYLTLEGNPLKDQFTLIKNIRNIKRSETSNQAQAFALGEGEWSSLQTPVNGDVSFFRVMKREKNIDPIEEQMEEGQKILSMDAKRMLMLQILEYIDIR